MNLFKAIQRWFWCDGCPEEKAKSNAYLQQITNLNAHIEGINKECREYNRLLQLERHQVKLLQETINPATTPKNKALRSELDKLTKKVDQLEADNKILNAENVRLVDLSNAQQKEIRIQLDPRSNWQPSDRETPKKKVGRPRKCSEPGADWLIKKMIKAGQNWKNEDNK